MPNHEYCSGVYVYIFSLVMFPYPVLEVSPSPPIEGYSMTLTCKIQLLAQRPDSQFRFCFFSDGKLLESGCSSSSKLQFPAIWRKNPEVYQCMAEETIYKKRGKWSLPIKIPVQRIPVSDVSLETWPTGGWVTEGNKLVLICSVVNATGNITYLWYRGALGSNLETKTQHSLSAEFEITEVKRRDAEQYYCAADNGYGPVLSELVSITVRVPVSRPVLTSGDSGIQAVLGDLVELHCEALRGSPPIFYQFYHENVILGNSSAPSGGGASFNLSLTAENSGNYYCEANNGQGAQRSEVVTLNIPVPMESGSNLTSGITAWLLGCLGLITMALIFCYWIKRKIGGQSDDPLRSLPMPVLQESSYLNSPGPEQIQSVYENVNIVRGDEIYSLVYHIQQELEPATAQHTKTHGASEVFSEIYSKPRKEDITDMDYEDTI